MSDVTEARRERKIGQPGPGTLDLADGPMPLAMPQHDMVEAQCFCGMATCPFCGHTVWDTGLNPGPHVIMCPRCGQSFTAP